jgi:biotin synthase
MASPALTQQSESVRHSWKVEEVLALLVMPFNDLLHQAHTVHRRHFDPNRIQVSRLLSIKTGGCSEDCAYCPQSSHYETKVEKEKLLAIETVVQAAKAAKAAGATRFCMGAAWRGPYGDDFATALSMIEAVKALGLETCASFGVLTREQARQLKSVGLDFYNHNLDTSERHYRAIVSTHEQKDRLETLAHAREAGLHLCSGGIVGLGESREDRASMLVTLANLPQPPESVPINMLLPVPGTPLAHAAPPDPFEFVRTIAAARITMPTSFVRLSAGREKMSDEMQALCFFAGANSVFCGEKLLVLKNKSPEEDRSLFGRLGLKPLGAP